MKTPIKQSFRFCMICSMLVLFSEVLIFGQDVIIKKSGEEIRAKVEEVLNFDIRYRKFENLTGPVYSMPKSEVSQIKYENGTSDFFAPVSAPSISQPVVASKPQIADMDIKPAKTGILLEIPVYASILAGVVVTAINTDMEDRYPMRYALLANTIIKGALIPISVSRGGKTRKNVYVSGSTGLRVSGWIIFGTSMATSLVTGFYLTENVEDPYVLYFPIYILDAVATTFFLLDNNKTVKQAKSLQNSASIQPSINIVTDYQGHKYSTVGFRITF
jgi:hypothetical protein